MFDKKMAVLADVRTVVESAWSASLGLAQAGGDANFFTLGGDSLTGMMLIAEVQERLGIAVTMADLLDNPTLDAFTEALSALHSGSMTLQSTRRPGAPARMTRLQHYRWKLRRHPVPGAEVSWLYRLDGRLNVEALCGAVDELIRRHEILRTTFGRHHGRPRQIVHPWRPGYLRILDMSDVPKRDRETAALQRIVDDDYRAFDYQRGPLIRPTLVRLTDTSHIFSVACSEMVIDGRSRRVVTSSINALYDLLDRGRDPACYPHPVLQFGDVAEGRRTLVSGSQYLEQLAYWKQRLRSADPLVELPDMGDGGDGRIQDRTLQLPPVLGTRVAAWARGLGVTPFSVLSAAFAALLGALKQDDEIAFTTTLAHRDLPGAEDMIGPFYNNVFVFVPTAKVVDGTTLVQATADALRESFRQSEVPLQQVEPFLPPVEEGRRGLRTNAVRFQLNEHPGEMRFGNVRAQPIRLPISGGPDLALLATSMPTGAIDLLLLHRPDLPKGLANAVLPAYRRVVSTLVEHPETPYEQILLASLRPAPSGSGRR